MFDFFFGCVFLISIRHLTNLGWKISFGSPEETAEVRVLQGPVGKANCPGIFGDGNQQEFLLEKLGNMGEKCTVTKKQVFVGTK